MNDNKTRILVIDDSKEVLYSIELIIREMLPEADILKTENCSTGFQLAETHSPDVILLDIIMPVMDGFEACRQLKASVTLRDIPVVFITARSANRESRIKALELGAEAFLTFPFDKYEFKALINAMLKIRKANQFKQSEKNHSEKMLMQNAIQLEKEQDIRKQAEEQIYENEEKYRALFDNSLAGIYLHDINGQILEVNREAIKQSGYSRQELLEMNVFDLYREIEEKNLPEEEVRELWKKTKAAASFTFEAEHKHKNGSTIPVQVKAGVIQYKNTKCILAMVQDITEQKQALLLLKESEERARRQRAAIASLAMNKSIMEGHLLASFQTVTRVIAETIGVAFTSIWLFNENASELRCESLYEAGQNRHTSGGALLVRDFPKYFEAITKDSRIAAHDAQHDPNTVEMLNSYLMPSNITSMLDTGIYKDANLAGVVCLEHTGKPRVWTTDEVAFVSTMGAFITRIIANDSRRRAEEKLIVSENHYRELFEMAADGILIGSNDGNIVNANAAFYELSGLQESDVIGKHVNDLPFDQENLRQNPFRFDLLEIGQVVEKQRVLIKPDGQPVHIEMRSKKLSEIGFQSIIRNISARKNAEESLSASEELNRKLLSTIPDIVIRTDINGNIVFTNETLEKNYPFLKEADVIGRDMLSFIAEQDRERAIKNTMLMFEKPLGPKEYKLTFGDFIFDSEVNGDVIYNNMSQPVGMVYVIRNITERRLAEEKNRENEARYQQLYTMMRLMSDTMPDMLWAKDLEKKYLFANKAICENLLMATDTSEPLGNTDLFFAERERSKQPDNPNWHTFGELCMDSDAITLANMKEMQFDEYGNVRGKFLYLDVRKAPLFDSNGKLMGVVGTARDITKRKRIESELKQQSNLRKLLMDISTEFINIPLGQVEETIDKALARMAEFVGADRAYIFDYDFDKQICINTYEWCSEGTSPQIDALQAVPNGDIPDWVASHVKGESVYISNIAELPEGGLKQILEMQGIKSVLSVPMLHDGKCIGFVGFDSVKKHHEYSEPELQLLDVFGNMLVNISQRKQNEQSLLAAKAKAEESDKLKSAFIKNISHEIRTPLNGIIGFGQFLADPDTSPDERNFFFDYVSKASERLINTVTDYMDMARLVSGTIEAHSYYFNLNDALKDVINDYRKMCLEKKIWFEVMEPDEPVESIVFSDKELIIKALNKLADNALKFTASGKITIGYTVHDRHLQFTVKDTGKGIAKDKLQEIFGMFIQEDMSMTREYEGSGLGLTIAAGFVALLDGKIWAESELGKGSAFYFTIPLGETDPQAKPEIIKMRKRALTSTPLVLLADDDESSFFFLELVVKKAGCNYLRADSGIEAVALCKDNPDISLVLMDVMMPEMNGMEAVKAIREFRPNLPVIALTAYAQTGDEKLFLSAGFDEYKVKPVTHKDLKRLLGKYLF